MTSSIVRPLYLGLLAAVAVGGATPALADGGRAHVPLQPAYVQECGSCHVAFAPGLLPASSWQHLMAGLKTHYGSDASLDAAAAQPLATWLLANAATGKRADPPQDDRITRAAWFQREHRETSATFGSARVKSASDCGACHTRAAEGSYREREIRVPR